jgi:hypothetical protein
LRALAGIALQPLLLLTGASLAVYVGAQESRLLSSLRHPNIVQFMGVCTEPACIITELCGRGSLTDVIRSAKASPADLPWTRRLDIVSKEELQCYWAGLVVLPWSAAAATPGPAGAPAAAAAAAAVVTAASTGHTAAAADPSQTCSVCFFINSLDARMAYRLLTLPEECCSSMRATLLSSTGAGAGAQGRL